MLERIAVIALGAVGLAALAGASGPAIAAEGLVLSVGEGARLAGQDPTPGTSLSTRLGKQSGDRIWFGSADYSSVTQRDDDWRSTQAITTVGGGMRMAVLSPTGPVHPYAVGQLFTVIPISSTTDGDGDRESELEEFLSLGALGSFGAQYRFAESAGVSAELGASYWYATYSEGKTDLTMTALGLVGAVHLDFYL